MGLLDGVKVVACTQAVQGGTIGGVLADLGADVIKIEDPAGDLVRGYRTILGVSVELPGSRNVLFEATNRNQRSMTLKLASDEGQAILAKLIERADVFVTNYRKSTRKRLGIDYPSLSRLNPRLVYGVASAYGEKGPSSNERAFDNVAFARAGMMYCIGEEESDPIYMVPGAVDVLGGTMLAFAVTGALYQREHTGKGQEVECSLLGSLVHFLNIPLSSYLLGGRVPRRPTRTQLFNPLVGWYRCRDGQWLMVSLNRPQVEWRAFCDTLGLGPDVEHDPKFDSIRNRAANCTELIALLDRVFATRDRDEWLAELRARDLICSPVNRVEDVANDAQVVANRYVVDVDHPAMGAVKMVVLPIVADGKGTEVKMVAPELGQHTEEILLDLGYSWDDIVALKSAGVA